MDKTGDELFCTSLELLKIIFRFQSPPLELKDFVEKGQPLNESTVSVTLYYLFGIINIEKTREWLMPSWPISYETRPRFRVGVKKFVTWMKIEWPDSQLKYSQSLLLNPHDLRFFPFLIKLACFTTKLLAERKKLEFDKSESLEQSKNNLAARMISFNKTRKELNAEYQNAVDMARKLDKESSILKNLLEKQEILLQDLIKSCPSKYHEKLLSDDWKSFCDLEEYNKLRDDNENKVKSLEAITSLFSDLSDGSLAGSTELDSKELLKFGIKNMLDPNIKENEIPLDQVLKICKDSSETYLHLLQNTPPSFEDKEQLQTALNEVEQLCNFYNDHYRQLIDLKNRAILKSNELDVILKEINPEPRPRKLSIFFDSPELTFPDVVNNDDSAFSSPGITGEQLLEDTKKYFKLKQNAATNECTGTDSTPVSRKISRIPRMMVSQKPNSSHQSEEPSRLNDEEIMAPPSSHLLGSFSLQPTTVSNQKSKKPSLDSSSSPLAISLLQKQMCYKSKPTQSKQSYHEAVVFSSTLCSNTSHKEIPAETIGEDLPSPISNTCPMADISDIDFTNDLSSLDRSNAVSLDTPSHLKPQLSGRPSLEALICRYNSLLKRIKPEENQ